MFVVVSWECACCSNISHDDYVLWNSGGTIQVRLAVCLVRYVSVGRMSFLVKVFFWCLIIRDG